MSTDWDPATANAPSSTARRRPDRQREQAADRDRGVFGDTRDVDQIAWDEPALAGIPHDRRPGHTDPYLGSLNAVARILLSEERPTRRTALMFLRYLSNPHRPPSEEDVLLRQVAAVILWCVALLCPSPAGGSDRKGKLPGNQPSAPATDAAAWARFTDHMQALAARRMRPGSSSAEREPGSSLLSDTSHWKHPHGGRSGSSSGFVPIAWTPAARMAREAGPARSQAAPSRSASQEAPDPKAEVSRLERVRRGERTFHVVLGDHGHPSALALLDQVFRDSRAGSRPPLFLVEGHKLAWPECMRAAQEAQARGAQVHDPVIGYSNPEILDSLAHNPRVSPIAKEAQLTNDQLRTLAFGEVEKSILAVNGACMRPATAALMGLEDGPFIALVDESLRLRDGLVELGGRDFALRIRRALAEVILEETNIWSAQLMDLRLRQHPESNEVLLMIGRGHRPMLELDYRDRVIPENELRVVSMCQDLRSMAASETAKRLAADR